MKRVLSTITVLVLCSSWGVSEEDKVNNLKVEGHFTSLKGRVDGLLDKKKSEEIRSNPAGPIKAATEKMQHAKGNDLRTAQLEALNVLNRVSKATLNENIELVKSLKRSSFLDVKERANTLFTKASSAVQDPPVLPMTKASLENLSQLVEEVKNSRNMCIAGDGEAEVLKKRILEAAKQLRLRNEEVQRQNREHLNRLGEGKGGKIPSLWHVEIAAQRLERISWAMEKASEEMSYKATRYPGEKKKHIPSAKDLEDLSQEALKLVPQMKKAFKLSGTPEEQEAQYRSIARHFVLFDPNRAMQNAMGSDALSGIYVGNFHRFWELGTDKTIFENPEKEAKDGFKTLNQEGQHLMGVSFLSSVTDDFLFEGDYPMTHYVGANPEELGKLVELNKDPNLKRFRDKFIELSYWNGPHQYYYVAKKELGELYKNLPDIGLQHAMNFMGKREEIRKNGKMIQSLDNLPYKIVSCESLIKESDEKLLKVPTQSFGERHLKPLKAEYETADRAAKEKRSEVSHSFEKTTGGYLP